MKYFRKKVNHAFSEDDGSLVDLSFLLSLCFNSSTKGANFSSNSSILSLDMGLWGKLRSSNVLMMFFLNILNIKKQQANIGKKRGVDLVDNYFESEDFKR